MATEVQEVALPFDPETAPLEELKAKINAGEVEKPAADKPEQKRDDKGQFVAAEEAVEEVEQAAEDIEEEIIYQRKIDLGDGSGVQVFQGKSLEELVDKLVKAQENATKKIRQLAEQQPKTNTSTKRQRTAEDEFLLSQELMTKPSAAFEKLFQESVGMPISEFKSNVEAVKVFNSSRAADEAAKSFVEATPEYFPNKANGVKVQNYLKTYQLPATLENITKAYTELNNSGLLQVRPAESASEVKEVTQDTPVQEVAPTVQKPRKASSGLSARGGAGPVVKKAPVTQEDFERETAGMTAAQIRAKAMSQNPIAKDPWDF
jgi:hypothetical protein